MDVTLVEVEVEAKMEMEMEIEQDQQQVGERTNYREPKGMMSQIDYH
jgi:hypothetical protein